MIIKKYELLPSTTQTMWVLGKVKPLCVKILMNKVYIYILEGENHAVNQEQLTISVVTEFETISDDFKYIDSFILNNDNIVYHVFTK